MLLTISSTTANPTTERLSESIQKLFNYQFEDPRFIEIIANVQNSDRLDALGSSNSKNNRRSLRLMGVKLTDLILTNLQVKKYSGQNDFTDTGKALDTMCPH